MRASEDTAGIQERMRPRIICARMRASRTQEAS